jgi:hypothetical protein
LSLDFHQVTGRHRILVIRGANRIVTRVTVPAVYAATPRVLITGWLDGASLSTLLDGRTGLLPPGWRELGRSGAADLAGQLLGHAATR